MAPKIGPDAEGRLPTFVLACSKEKGLPKQRIQKIGVLTASAIVVANMIGTGAFTSLGFQLNDLNNPMVIITLWILGGLLALSGAFSYAEIGTHIQKSGGEYTFLTEIFSPFLGFLAGWISSTVGFAAPVALSAIAVVEYFPYWNLDPIWTSIPIVGIITVIHSFSLRSSSLFCSNQLKSTSAPI